MNGAVMERIAITAMGPTPDSDIDERLGRAYWILIHDPETDEWTPIDNAVNRNALRCAGLRTVQTLIDLGVTHILTAETGPKAYRTLMQAGIRVYHGATGTVLETLEAWREGRLVPARAANDIGSPFCLMADEPLTSNPYLPDWG